MPTVGRGETSKASDGGRSGDANQRVSANGAHPTSTRTQPTSPPHVSGPDCRAALGLSGVSSGNFWLTT